MNVNEEKEFSKNYDFEIWKNLLRYVKPFKKNFIYLGCLVILLGIVEATIPVFTTIALDTFVAKETLDNFPRFVAAYMGVISLLSLIAFLFIKEAGRMEANITYVLREKGFKKLQELSFSYFDKTAVGWLMARMTSDAMRIGEIIAWGLVDFLWGITMMIFIAIFMFAYSVKLALITLTVVPLLIVVSLFFQKKILKVSRQVRKVNSKITGAFNEGITGAKTTKTLVREDENLNEFKSITQEMSKRSIRSALISAVYMPIVISMGSVGMALAIGFGGRGVGTFITYGVLVLFIQYAVQFYEPIREMARIFSELQVAQASAERLLSMIDTPADIVDSEDVQEKYGTNIEPKKENWEDLKGDISFKDVTFYYNPEEVILENFNLDVKEGQTIALVGETGSGKSTLVNLACRFYEPNKGQVLIDGVDYKERSQLWLHSNIGYVLQTPHLFSGTIRENIMYGDLQASELDIIRASKLVNAHDFIMKFEKGYDTEVGEGGAKLSTGEKQLISFARAILSDPKLFILDEATSSVDTETELLVQSAIKNVLEGRTSFIVAHRLSTIRSVDRILVIDKGRIVEDGDHERLMKNKGHYYKLYTHQFIDEQELETINH